MLVNLVGSDPVHNRLTGKIKKQPISSELRADWSKLREHLQNELPLDPADCPNQKEVSSGGIHMTVPAATDPVGDRINFIDSTMSLRLSLHYSGNMEPN